MEWGSMYLNLLVVALMFVLLYYKNYLKIAFLALKLPSPPSVPFLGHVLYVTNHKKLIWIGSNASSLYGPLIPCWISIMPFFFIYEPNDLQTILSTNKLSTKNMFYSLLHNFIGEGLITNTGEKWKFHRKLIQPYFHVNMLKVYFNAFKKSSSMIVEDLEYCTDLNIVKIANKFVLDVLHATVLGIAPQTNSQESPFRKGKVFVQHRITKPWLLLKNIFKMTDEAKEEVSHKKRLQNYTRKILNQKRSEMEFKEPEVRTNLIEMFIDIAKSNPAFTDEDIINEACTFMLAGQDSIGAALTFSLFFLAENQNAQTKVVEELDNIFQESNREVEYEDLQEMKYLEQCIKETMRLCPSVPIIARKTTQDVTLGKETIPAGTNIFISPFITHRLPHIYKNPSEFNPDRFSIENKEKLHPYAYLPFSAGPRNCIGYKFALLELKTVLSSILRNFHVSKVPGHEELELAYKVTLKAKGGIWINFKKRAPYTEEKIR